MEVGIISLLGPYFDAHKFIINLNDEVFKKFLLIEMNEHIPVSGQFYEIFFPRHLFFAYDIHEISRDKYHYGIISTMRDLFLT